MPNTKLINCDQLQMSLEKVKTYVDGAFSKTTHNHDNRYYTETEIDETVTALTTAINGKANSSHNQASNTINAMTGYSIATSSAAITTADTLNAAIGKLEYKINQKQDGGSYAPAIHTHDDRYYTESEINTKISALETADSNNLAAAKTYADGKIAALVDSAPETLDTLNELAAALGDDPNFATTITTALGNKADKTHTHPAASTTANGFMTSAMVTKLNGIADNANNYTHPTTSGNKHIPSGGSSGQFLGWSADGTAQWVANPNTDSKVQTTADTSSTKLYITGATGATTGALKYNAGIYFNATTGALTAGSFNGKATSAGTADTATTATTANKVANSLTIQLNGSSQGAWDGSAAKTVNITPSSIGAPTTADVAKATDAEVTAMLTTIFG